MSDPSAIQLPVSQALTSDMLLGLKPAAPKCRSYRLNVAPLNKSTFTGSDQMIFEIPCGRKGTWLDQSQSYLKFSVQCAATAACAANVSAAGVYGGIYIDNSAYSFIQRLDIYHSSNLLETVNEYGQLANFLIDTSLTQSDKAGLSSMIGTNNQTISQLGAGAPAAWNTTQELQRAGDRSGLSLTATQLAGGIPAGTTPYTFSLPVLSGVIGINASKMLPVGKLNSPIRCEFYTSANDDAITYGTAGAGATWQIINAELVCCFVELSEDLPSAPGVPEYISTKTYRQASTYMPAATSGEFTTLLPFRCASLTALYTRCRPYASAAQGASATCAYRKGASINPNFSYVYWRVGSSMMPNKPIYLLSTQVGQGAEGFAELLKSFHALSSSIGNTSIVSPQYNTASTATLGWNVATPVGAVAAQLGSHYNAFALGIELESFSNRTDTILSGVSTLNSQVFMTAGVYTGLTVGGAGNLNFTLDFFAQMDMILVMQDGTLMAKF